MLCAQGRKRSVSALLICLALLIFWMADPSGRLRATQVRLPFKETKPKEVPVDLPPRPRPGEELEETQRPPCRDLAGMDDLLVVLRTGSTELEDRLPIHLSTTLQCVKHYMIFSDVAEQYHGESILDALETVSENTRTTHKDFELYRRLQSGGRAVLAPSELTNGSPEASARGAGNEENPGWKLDKWKFMPMLNRTYHDYPAMKWYVFIEADTYLLWSMLLQYLSLLDPGKSHYRGSATCLGSSTFAHGGSGFVISQPALHSVVRHNEAHQVEIEELTDHEWAGDFIVGKTLEAAGVYCTDAWPHFQGDFPGHMGYTGSDEGTAVSVKEWCRPTVSYHHMASDMIKSLWTFEQNWLMAQPNRTDTLTHGNMFKEYVMPQMSPRVNWDNFSDKEEEDVSDLEACRARCGAQPKCKQYSFVDGTKLCRTREEPRLGFAGTGIQSGWMQDRVSEATHDVTTCSEQGWQVSSDRYAC